MKNSILISAVVPCYNASAYVSDAIDSLRRQTCADMEIIAVDDGSKDNTREILDQHAGEDRRVRIVAQPNRGLPAARNAGLRVAGGEYVCFLDADDVLLPDKVEKQLAFLDRNPDCDLVYSDYLIGDTRLDPVGLIAVRIPPGDTLDAFACRNWFAPMVPLLRRSLVERVGEFDESLRAAEDWDYWIRCAKAGRFRYLPGAVGIYRTHPSQMHLDHNRMFTAGRQVIEKQFGSDSRRYRASLSAFYWANAKYRFAARDRWKAGIYAALSGLNGRMANGFGRRETTDWRSFRYGV